MKLGYTILYVHDVGESVAFYEAAFGLSKRFVQENDYAEMETGETTLAFADFELARSNNTPFNEPSVNGPSPPVEVAFVTDDVAAAFAKAIDAGAAPLAEPKQKPWGQTVSYVRELNGFIVEICSPVEK